MEFFRDLANYAESSNVLDAFKTLHSFDTRRAESTRIRLKYPNRVPIIVEQISESEKHFKLKNKKYLIPVDLTVGQFIYILRNSVRLNEEFALFMFASNNTIPMTSALVSAIYHEHADKDGFLYFSITTEQTYG